jgi:type IV pilus assembly protein PilV
MTSSTSLRQRLTKTQRHRARRGMVLVEVLVAALIFAFGVLGIVGLQAHLKRSEISNRFRVIAMTVANDLIGTMWGDPANLASFATAGGNCDGYATCAAWKTKVANNLPSGAAVVTVLPPALPSGPGVSAGADVQIQLSWQTPDGAQRYDTNTTVRLR